MTETSNHTRRQFSVSAYLVCETRMIETMKPHGRPHPAIGRAFKAKKIAVLAPIERLFSGV